MSTRGKVWVFGIIPALVVFWAAIIRLVITVGGRIMKR